MSNAMHGPSLLTAATTRPSPRLLLIPGPGMNPANRCLPRKAGRQEYSQQAVHLAIYRKMTNAPHVFTFFFFFFYYYYYYDYFFFFGELILGGEKSPQINHSSSTLSRTDRWITLRTAIGRSSKLHCEATRKMDGATLNCIK